MYILRTDGLHDGPTNGQTSRTITIGSFFEKKNTKKCKTICKNNNMSM